MNNELKRINKFLDDEKISDENERATITSMLLADKVMEDLEEDNDEDD